MVEGPLSSAGCNTCHTSCEELRLELNKGVLMYRLDQPNAAESSLVRPLEHFDWLPEDAALELTIVLANLYYKSRRPHKLAYLLHRLSNRFQLAGTSRHTASICASRGGQHDAQPTDQHKARKLEQPPTVIVNMAEVGQLLHLFGARLQLLLHNVDAATHAVEELLAKDGENREALFLLCEIHLLQGDYTAASHWLSRACCASGEPSPPLELHLLCNTGVIQQLLGKNNIAALCFQRAMAKLQANACGGDVSVPPDPTPTLKYNLALQKLALRDYDSAGQLLHQCIVEYGQQPLLWIRIAECCIGLHDERTHSSEQQVAGCQVVTTKWHTSAAAHTQAAAMQVPEELVGVQDHDTEGAVVCGPALTLHYAVSCCNTASRLLDSEQQQLQEQRTLQMQQTDEDAESMDRFFVAELSRLSTIRTALLAKTAYLNIIIGNPSDAAGAAHQLLQGCNLTPDLVMCGSCYLAESYAMQGQFTAAADSLTQLAQGSEQQQQQLDVGCANAKLCSLTNLSALHTLTGSMHKAEEAAMSALQHDAACGPAMLLAMYSSLAQGKTQQAVELMAQHNNILM